MENKVHSHANENVKRQLMTAIRRDQKDQVLSILQREGRSLSDTELMEAMRCAVYFRNKDILLKLLIDNTRCYDVFRAKFHLQTWKDSLRPESNRRGAGRGELFWIFDTLYMGGQRHFAILVAAAFPEKTLTKRKIVPAVKPAIDSLIRFLICFTADDDMMSRHHALAEEPSLTSLKQWCMENRNVNKAFYLAVLTKDWELVETMASTQTSHHVHPRLLYECIVFMLDDRRADNIRACSAAVAVLKNYPLNKESVQYVPIPYGQHYPFYGLHYSCGLQYQSGLERLGKGLERVAKACGDQGLLDWALLLTSDLAYIKRHYKNCHNQDILNQILVNVVCFEHNEWQFARKLMSRCSDIETLGIVLRKVFQKGVIDVAKEMMSRMDPSAITKHCYSTLLLAAVSTEARDRQDTDRRLVRLCIASGLSTFQRSLTIPQDFCFFPTTPIPKLQIMKLLVESGTFTHRILHELCSEVQSMLSGQASEDEQKCCRYIQEAAATPCSLQHLARLTLSHSIGCQPGRYDRIQALPLPNILKPYLRFRDVLKADTQFHKKSEDREN